ncbi:putative nepenthesin [Helianthus anomalus]
MPVSFDAGAVVLVLLQAAVVVCDFPATFKLERAFSTKDPIGLAELKNRDGLRHRRILQQQSSPHVFDFPVGGTFDPFYAGLYYTKVRLGSPPKDYYVEIDTGSDALWVRCTPCYGCPTRSRLHIPVELYDPSSSSTSSLISCSDKRCSQADCSNKQCSYTLRYADGSESSGYYVSDFMHLNITGIGSVSSNSSSNVVFGCSTSQTGEYNDTRIATSGVLGLGQNGLSIISQLSSEGIAPKAFSHCFLGSRSGEGVFVIGYIIEPNMVFTPLVQSQRHYNVNLQSISVNGQTLPINPSTFAIADNQNGTIIDSGTTLAYFSEAAFRPIVDAIAQSVLQTVQPLNEYDPMCYAITSSVSNIFPTVSLNFAGGGSMHLRPQDYLLPQNTVNEPEVWCIGFQEIHDQGRVILGDLVLKNKIIVYDIEGQRIGWSDYDCSSSINVSSTLRGGTSEAVNAGETSVQITRYTLTLVLILASILHLGVSCRSLFVVPFFY